ncbi:MAG: formylglycine-generating enzyme family protein [Bdellovibrio bacteriovorus]
MSHAPTRSIALYLGLVLCALGIGGTPPLSVASQEPKKTGDLGFWEELAFWETIKDSRDPKEFQAYLAAYPAGRFARLAEIRIQALIAQPAPDSPSAPPQAQAEEGQGSAGTVSETADAGATPAAGGTFRDCDLCPLMAEVPAGTYLMGSDGGRADEQPRHEVRFPKPFAIGIHEVTVAEWDLCLREGGCRFTPEAGLDARLPMGNLSWDDAQAYVDWLSTRTGQAYRLPTEAEWEYAASGGTSTAYWWGDEVGRGRANCTNCGSDWDGKGPAPVGSFEPNPFGLYDVHGNLWEWTMDCGNRSYKGAPTDGSAWLRGDCFSRVLRGGSWNLGSEYMRTTRRHLYDRDVRYYLHGFRAARSLP